MGAVGVILACRRIIGRRLTESMPDISALCRNRRRRVDGTDISQRLVDHIVEQTFIRGVRVVRCLGPWRGRDNARLAIEHARTPPADGTGLTETSALPA